MWVTYVCADFFSSGGGGGGSYCIRDGLRESFSNRERNLALRVRDEITNLEAGGVEGVGAGGWRGWGSALCGTSCTVTVELSIGDRSWRETGGEKEKKRPLA